MILSNLEQYIFYNAKNAIYGVCRSATGRSKSALTAGAVSVFDKPIERDQFLARVKRYMLSHDMWKNQLQSFLEDNYTNPELKFEDIMHYFKFSKTYGYELFKKHLGESFRMCLRKVRLTKAEEALKNTSDSISEIAYQCGFAYLSTFSRVFKATYGDNPTTYRRKWKLQQILNSRTNS